MAATLQIFTFKAGLLSRLAHDLRLGCASWRIEVEAGRVSATFDPRTLRVEGVMKDGRLDPAGLSPSDYRKIEATVRDEILKTRQHPAIEFAGRLEPSGDTVEVEGELQLAGRRASIGRSRARKRGDAWTIEVELAPTRWGVAPYRALGGTLKLQDRVLVRITLPAVEGVDVKAGAHAWTRG